MPFIDILPTTPHILRSVDIIKATKPVKSVFKTDADLAALTVTEPWNGFQDPTRTGTGADKTVQRLSRAYSESSATVSIADLYNIVNYGAGTGVSKANVQGAQLLPSVPQAQTTQKQAALAQSGNITIQQLHEAYNKADVLARNADKAVREAAMTENDNIYVKDLLAGLRRIDDEIPAGMNAGGIRRVYEEKKQVQDAMRPVNLFNAQRKRQLVDEANSLLEGSDAWKDKKAGIRSSLETMPRNVQDDESDFLTNRYGTDNLRTPVARQVSNFLSKPFAWIDSFTSQVVTRAKFYDNMNTGMDRQTALKNADRWAASVMGDRSKGATPTYFNRKNPLAKMFGMFQLEVNNNLRHIFKDMPRQAADEAKKHLALMLLKYFIGAYLFNDIFEYFTGRRPALDVFGMFGEAVSDLSGFKVPRAFAAASERNGRGGTLTGLQISKVVNEVLATKILHCFYALK